MLRNTKEYTLNGKQIGFRTGTMAIAKAIEESRAGSTEEFFKRLAAGDLVAINALYYGAAYQYFTWKNLPIDFNMTHVSEWLEDLGIDKSVEVINAMIESYVPKNQAPPIQTGEAQQSMNGSTLQSQPEESVAPSSGG